MYIGWSVMEEIPPGFRFYPTEEELVSFYLPQKLEGRRQDLDRVIPLLSVYDFNPWDLPQFVGELCRGDPEQWFFFVPRQEKETRGGRPSRLTKLGYWKATGSPGFVYSSSGRVIGEKRIMVFYRGRAPNGEKTEWKMNEYTAIDGEAASSSSTTSTPPKLRRELSLCRVYVKSKCLRAFDRRPSTIGLVMRNELGTSDDQRRLIPAPPPNHNGDDHDQPSHGRAISHDQYQRNTPNDDDDDDRSSSSAGNHDIAVHPHHDQINQSGETGNYRVDDSSSSNDPLWEWEQLNWF